VTVVVQFARDEGVRRAAAAAALYQNDERGVIEFDIGPVVAQVVPDSASAEYYDSKRHPTDDLGQHTGWWHN
jgi:hypothetical protein